MIDGNKFIDMLYLSQTDESVINMRKELNVPKPLIDKKFKQYGGNSIPMEDIGIELFFKDGCKYDGNDTGVYGKGDIVFGGITFSYNSKISAPFNLKMGENYDTVLEKIGRSQDYDTESFPQKVWKFLKDDNKEYLLYAFFEDDYSELLNLSLFTYTPQVEKLLKHIPTV